MERSEGLREAVAEAIYDCDSLRVSDPGLFQMMKGAVYYSGSVAHSLSLEDADAALNAITASGFVIVRRDDLEEAIEVAEWSDSYDSEHFDAMGRLRAALAPTDAGTKEDGV